MAFRLLPLIAMNPHSWSVGEVALLQVLVVLDANIVKEEEGTLVYALTPSDRKGMMLSSL